MNVLSVSRRRRVSWLAVWLALVCLTALRTSVRASPPATAAEPEDLATVVGSNATFSVTVSGSEPLACQWYFNTNTLLTGETQAVLTLSNVQVSQEGTYSLTASNAEGQVSSRASRLVIERAVLEQWQTLGSDSLAACWGDYDGDGYPDLYITSDGNQANQLFRNAKDGMLDPVTGVPATAAAGQGSRAATWVDLDEDGDLDLLVSNHSVPLWAFRNEGGALVPWSIASVTDTGYGLTHGVAWGDADRDGHVDLFVSVADGNNLFFRNSRPGLLEPELIGPLVNDGGTSVGASWVDFDNDGWPDLSVANRGAEANFFYRNNGAGVLVRLSSTPMSTDLGMFKCMAWGDCDNDGDEDLFAAAYDTSGAFYRNNGPSGFERFPAIVGYEEGLGGLYCASWGDYDNDGDLDLFAGAHSQSGSLFINSGGGAFVRAAHGDAGAIASIHGAAWADYDRDGDLDLAVARPMALESYLLRNGGNSNAWLVVRCLMRTAQGPERDAVGAKVLARAEIRGGSVQQLRVIRCGGEGGEGSQSPMEAHFGLGDAANVEELRIEWPSGAVQTLTNVEPRQFLTIHEASDGPPAISVQPLQSLRVAVGANLTIQAVVVGQPPLSCAWYRNATSLLQVGTNATLVISNAVPTDSGDYTLVVSNAFGMVTSRVGRVSVFYEAGFVRDHSWPRDGTYTYAPAFADYDGDGWLDLCVSHVGDNRGNLLYRNRGDGTFVSVTDTPISEATGDTGNHGLAWADFDNDGDLDLFGTRNALGGNHLYVNQGGGMFTVVTNIPPTVGPSMDWQQPVWGDYDNDGFLDLFVSTIRGVNALYHGSAGGVFVQVTDGPVITDGAPWSAGAAWGDFTGDGYLDLVVANDSTRGPPGWDYLYQNQAGFGFTRVADGPLVEQEGDSLAVSWGDYNNDGMLDLVVVPYGQPLRLFRNEGGVLAAVAAGALTEEVHSYSSACWGDYDNDGDLDLFLTTRSGNLLYRNDGEDSFTKMTAIPPATDVGQSGSAMWGDVDRDGDLDLYVANIYEEDDFFFRNSGNSAAWLELGLVRASGQRGGIGTVVRALSTIGGREAWQMRQAGSDVSLVAQGAAPLHFGLGDATNVTTLRIEWPSGRTQEVHNLAPRQFLTVTEAPSVLVLPAERVVYAGDIGELQVTAAGAEPLTYQWLRDGVELAGATNTALSLGRVDYDLAGPYQVVVGNDLGSITSAVVQVRVALPLELSTLGRGTVVPMPDTDAHEYGQTLQLSAVPDALYTFGGWTDGSQENPRLIVLGLTNHYTAVFTNAEPVELQWPRQWEQVLGGTNADLGFAAAATTDGGLLVGGKSASPTGLAKSTTNYGGNDGWLVKLDAAGAVEWERVLGGTADDEFLEIRPMPDGGWMAGGSSQSGADGNKTSPSYGSWDWWLIRLDAAGEVVWQRSYGGSGADYLRGLVPTFDGGCLLVGSAHENSVCGTRTAPAYGLFDGWAVRVDAAGEVLWDRSFGGTSNDSLMRVVPADFGWWVAGSSASAASGTKTAAQQGGYDWWLLRLDARGLQEGEWTFGGGGDDYLRAMAGTGDGGVVMGGSSASSAAVPNGNKTATQYGGDDFWVVRLGADGAERWQRTYGGEGTDQLQAMVSTGDGGWLLGGFSDSAVSGVKSSAPFGGWDGWLVRVDAEGAMRWEETHGGDGDDSVAALARAVDGSYDAVGSSGSGASGDKAMAGYGLEDLWAFRQSEREAPVGTPLVLVNGFHHPDGVFSIPATNQVLVTIQTGFANGFIHYTLDGSEPDAGSAVYTGPIVLADSAVVRALAYDEHYIDFEMAGLTTIQLLPVYALNAWTAGGGTVMRSPESDLYASNSVVTLSAVPAAGWSFMGWQGSTNAAAPVLELCMVEARSVEAVFGSDLTLTLPSGGTLMRQPATGLAAYGRGVQLTALPSVNRYFLRWTGAASGVSNSPLTFVVTNANPTVGGLFGTLPAGSHSLVVQVEGEGEVRQAPQLPYYASGATVLLTANAASNQVFQGWSGDVVSIANPLEVVMDANRSIQATFADVLPPNEAPSVRLTSPLGGAVYTAPANVGVAAVASDPEGALAQVEFYAGTVRTKVLNGGPFAFTWTGVPAGAYALTAVATDQGGLSATSAVVNIEVRLPILGPPVFTLDRASYPVAEAGGSVSVVVRKSLNSLAGTVNYATADGSARAVSGGVGDYEAVSGQLSFAAGDLTRTVVIPLLDDSAYEGPQTFTFALSGPGMGGALGSTPVATITIEDDDLPASLGSLTDHVFPGGVPAHAGELQIRLEPAAAGMGWRRVWETEWRSSEAIVSGLPSGNYEIEFKPVEGYAQPPNETFEVLSPFRTSGTNYYIQTAALESGPLQVMIEPVAVAAAVDVNLRGQWRLLGEGGWRDSGGMIAALPAGRHTVEFKAVSGRQTPAPANAVVYGGQGNQISRTYWLAGTSGGTPPSVLQYTDIRDAAVLRLPYGYVGQLLTDVGYGTGFVVKEHAVLTAAHMVFNDARLEQVQDARWFFQRHKEDYEPLPLIARGWYVFSGYAAQREAEGTPGISSPSSYQLDAAALYFLESAGRGGYGGYLVSSSGQTEWLQTTALKSLVGYPVEGITSVDVGRMHATTPGNIAFSAVMDRVFGTTQVRSFGGGSGGPLCVQYTNGMFYPAAIYLGGTAQTIVRAIDASVVDLINRAELTAATGDNNVGGGAELFAPELGAVALSPGRIQVRVTPAEAVLGGAGWKFVGSGQVNYVGGADTVAALLPAVYELTFKTIPGYTTPTNRSVTVVADQTTVVDVTYAVDNGTPPVLGNDARVEDGKLALTVTGAAGQTVVIETKATLNDPQWTPVWTNAFATAGSEGFEEPVSAAGSRFYRARVE